jgi:hypothetical protein
MTAEEESNINWGLTTWKGSRLQQHREFHALSFRRKLEAIEELGDLARRFQDQRKCQGLPYISTETGERVPGALVREDPPASDEKLEKETKSPEP